MKYFLFFISFYITIQAQSLQFVSFIGDFSDASSISINPAGYIFIADKNTNEIYKLDTLGNVLKSIGGYGWSEYSFDQPTDIFATTLNVYICDRNNHRIQIYDKDLNFLSGFSSNGSDNQNITFEFPTCSAVSNQGDLYLLDSDNSRILKYNLRGEFLLEIGSYDAGDFMLSNPISFSISSDNNLYLIDGNQMIIFDQYGMGLDKIDLGFEPNNINITFSKIVISNHDTIKFGDLNSPIFVLNDLFGYPELENKIIDANIFKNKLYVLQPGRITVYNISK
ncbi:MAG: hypothetical protein A2V66_01160 [Ignavibacteria bacterium RBG_13_36_8]|nr:MAG: hypothetical protein A2V66_01160 [Ignavibacteria bacterium RBG_13_36_8]